MREMFKDADMSLVLNRLYMVRNLRKLSLHLKMHSRYYQSRGGNKNVYFFSEKCSNNTGVEFWHSFLVRNIVKSEI